MSFAYAQIARSGTTGAVEARITVYCDTKITLPSTSRLIMNDLTVRAAKAFGVCKIHIHDGNYCVSFAGNDIGKACELLLWLEEGNCESFDSLARMAFRVHRSAASKDDIEFILCAARNDDGEPEIACVKEGALIRGLEQAWIGSYEAFRLLQRSILERAAANERASVSIDQVYEAIYSCDDETVGGLVICANTYGGMFEYGYCYFTAVNREQTVPLGGAITLFHSAEEGGFAVEVCDRGGDPFLTFPQIGRSLVYSAKMRYEGEPSIASPMDLIRLPILLETGTDVAIDPEAIG